MPQAAQGWHRLGKHQTAPARRRTSRPAGVGSAQQLSCRAAAHVQERTASPCTSPAAAHLHDGDVLIRGARRRVDDQVVAGAPVHVFQEPAGWGGGATTWMQCKAAVVAPRSGGSSGTPWSWPKEALCTTKTAVRPPKQALPWDFKVASPFTGRQHCPLPPHVRCTHCLMRPFLRGPRQITASSGLGSMKPMDMTPRFSCTKVWNKTSGWKGSSIN